MDGNPVPKPLSVEALSLAVAERVVCLRGQGHGDPVDRVPCGKQRLPELTQIVAPVRCGGWVRHGHHCAGPAFVLQPRGCDDEDPRQCMRRHGISQFPDPRTTIGFGFQISNTTGELPAPLSSLSLHLPPGIDYETLARLAALTERHTTPSD